MIIQGLMDFASQWLAGLVSLLPPLPAELASQVGGAAGAAQDLGATVARFGIIIPWDVVSGCLATFVALMGFWGAVQVVRLVLWAVGR